MYKKRDGGRQPVPLPLGWMAGSDTETKTNADGGQPSTRGRAQRERIVAAALEMMAEGGEASVSLVAVARRAGITRGTVYYHFGDREALLAASRASLQAELLKLAHGPHHFRNPFGLAVRLAVEDPSILRSRVRRILEQGPAQDERVQKLLSRLGEMEQAGELRPGVNPVALALVTAAIDFAGLMAIDLAPDRDRQRELAASLAETWHQLFVHGALREAEAE